MGLKASKSEKSSLLRYLQNIGDRNDRILLRLARRLEGSEARRAAANTLLAAGTHRAVSDPRASFGRRIWHIAKAERPPCGAKCRSGQPCQARVVSREDGTLARRCRLHGGLSTGPKSEAGRARIAESNRRRANSR